MHFHGCLFSGLPDQKSSLSVDTGNDTETKMEQPTPVTSMSCSLWNHVTASLNIPSLCHPIKRYLLDPKTPVLMAEPQDGQKRPPAPLQASLAPPTKCTNSCLTAGFISRALFLLEVEISKRLNYRAGQTQA